MAKSTHIPQLTIMQDLGIGSEWPSISAGPSHSGGGDASCQVALEASTVTHHNDHHYRVYPNLWRLTACRQHTVLYLYRRAGFYKKKKLFLNNMSDCTVCLKSDLSYMQTVIIWTRLFHVHAKGKGKGWQESGKSMATKQWL